ncbi:thyrotropin-releasing hormone receptor isoform X2 [Bicyclus anynana]|uniref:Thyrotropin-releasing hormone receptor isoform X2 n=1 Tax=Bicyclus anynana TaxID=110368 RepID=A0ABM3M0T0_BICAN|nr:thyrotropin-releasing hormone receptor isoform X2 [Bicyclus anynana]
MISIANFTHTNTHTQIHYNTTTYKNATQSPRDGADFFEKFDYQNGSYNSTTFEMSNNYTEYAEIPYYIKATSMTFCIVIMCLGVIGNVMVPIVILKTKDMRNSTNIFLVNLSIADLMVLLVCTTTTLVEVNSKPETWVLGRELCLAVPFIELTVAHASVLTILAISFERYYAICEPLRAGYVCTKTRATLICGLAWFFAALFTSPILAIVELHTVSRSDGTFYQCLTQAVTLWQTTFFVMIIIFLYLLPLVILIVLYTVIAKNLITAASKVVLNKTVDPYNARARKQVILMLGTVVLCFFLCLMPYRVLVLWIIISPSELSENVSPEKWYNLLYFSRIMLYINSAINPILYNLMSSKFRIGFCKVCICYNRSSETQNRRVHRTVTNGSTTSSSLSRTTNSLKKLFTHRSSLDKSDTEYDNKDVKDDGTTKNRLLNRMFPNKRFIRQQSAPVCANPKTKVINRMRSEGSMLEVSDVLDKNKECRSDTAKFIGHSNITKNRLDIELESNRDHGSLRRSVLINSAKAKSLEVDPNKKFVSYQKIKVDCVVGFQKSKSVDYDFPESFV